MSFINGLISKTKEMRDVSKDLGKVLEENDIDVPEGGGPPKDASEFSEEGYHTGEYTVSGSTVFGGDNIERPESDITHSDRIKMKRDATIRFASLLRKFSLLGQGYNISSAINNEDAEGYEDSKEKRQFIIDKLEEDYEGTFSEGLRGILSATDHGISISEKNWKVNDNNEVVLKDIKTRENNLNTFEIQKDKHGNIEKVIQKEDGDTEIPLDKLIIFSYLAEGDKVTGIGDLESAWDSWFRKRAIKEFWGSFLELRSKVNAIAKIPDTNLNSQLAQNIWKMLKNVQLGGRMMIPENIDVDTLQLSKSHSLPYHQAIKYFDGQILKSYLVPQLMGESTGETTVAGSFALGVKHFNIFILSLKYIKKKLEKKINNEIIKPMIDYNFESEDNYPKFYLNVLQEDNIEARTDVLELLLDAGVVSANEEWIRNYMNVPEAGDVGVEGVEDDSGVDSDETEFSETEMYKELKGLSEEIDLEEIKDVTRSLEEATDV